MPASPPCSEGRLPVPEGFLLLPGDGLVLVAADGRVLHLDRDARQRLGPATDDWPGAAVGEVWPELGEELSRWPVSRLEEGPEDLAIQQAGQRWPCRLFRTDDGWGVGLLAPRAADGRPIGDGGAHTALIDALLREVWDAVLVTTAEPFDVPGPVIVYANPGVLRQSGHALHHVLGRSPRMFQGPDTDPAVRARFRAALERWEPVREEILNYRRDGERFWVDIAITPMAAADGWYTHWVSVQRDMTASRAIREALEETRERLRLLAENVTDVAVFADADLRCQWINPAGSELLGWTLEELAGLPLQELVHPDDRSCLAALPALRLQGTGGTTGAPPAPAGEPVDPVVRLRGPGGGWRLMLLRLAPVVGGAGERLGYVVGLRDVEELIRQRQRSEADRARLTATLDSLLDAHVVMEAVRDPEGTVIDFRYVDANEAACRYSGIPRDRLLGTRLLEVLPSQRSSGLFDRYRAVLETGEPLVVNDFVYANELHPEPRRYDLRGVRLGDAITLTWRDVTDRWEAARRLAESEEYFRLLAENVSDVVVRLADDGTVLWVSPSLTPTLGWRCEEWLGRPASDFLLPHADGPEPAEALMERIRAGESIVTRDRLRARDETVHWVETHTSPYRDAGGRIEGRVSSFRLVDQQVEAELELDRRARTDDLTGLLNRGEMLERLDHLGTDLGPDREAAAVLFCDFDRFKAINDSYGHLAGDEVLRVVAERIRGCLRSSDLAARVGGDELLVVLRGVRDLGNALSIAENLRRVVSAPVPTPAGSLVATLSIGVTLVQAGEGVDALIARADEAMYQAKSRGRNLVIPIQAEPSE